MIASFLSSLLTYYVIARHDRHIVLNVKKTRYLRRRQQLPFSFILISVEKTEDTSK